MSGIEQMSSQELNAKLMEFTGIIINEAGTERATLAHASLNQVFVALQNRGASQQAVDNAVTEQGVSDVPGQPEDAVLSNITMIQDRAPSKETAEQASSAAPEADIMEEDERSLPELGSSMWADDAEEAAYKIAAEKEEARRKEQRAANMAAKATPAQNLKRQPDDDAGETPWQRQ